MMAQLDREIDMSRFIQESFNNPKPTKEPKPTPKFGGKTGNKDYSGLADAKKIITPEGGRR